jgi:hypothetical protein
LSFVAAATVFGCSQQQSKQAVVVEERAYTVTPASAAVRAGIVTGELTEMKITDKVEQGSGTVVSPPKLSGTLKLKNSSDDRAVRLLGGKLLYIDPQGRPIALGDSRAECKIEFGSYGSTDRLDPGQEVSQALEVDFPAAAVGAAKLKEIRLQLAYLPMPYSSETAQFAISVRGP